MRRTDVVADERQIVAPVAFPSFVEKILGWSPGVNLSTEIQSDEGRPDFVPADAVTHPFVFEVKGTEAGVLVGGDAHLPQVERYLTRGGARIRKVALVNLVGIRVFSLDASGSAVEDYRVDLRGLDILTQDAAAGDKRAISLARFIGDFHYLHLTTAEKVDRIRQASPWNHDLEVTDTDWVVQRISDIVGLLTDDAKQRVKVALPQAIAIDPNLQPMVLSELHTLELQVGAKDSDSNAHTLTDYLKATSGTEAEALTQFLRNTAFYNMTRLLLVRVWEDVDLVPSRLLDGGFDQIMTVLDNVEKVVNQAFSEAKSTYPSLFTESNAFSWYKPSEGALVDALYDLANTYLGGLSDDILGDIYQRQLSLADRKQLGQYYTPRDIIGLIWGLVDPEEMASSRGGPLFPLRVYDFATGSGGFLVAYAHQRKGKILTALDGGGNINLQNQMIDLANSLVGSEISQFSAYLTEVNLVLQLSTLVARDSGLTIPDLRIHCTDSLTLHNPDTLVESEDSLATGGLTDAGLRHDSRNRLIDPSATGEWFDICVGNPPYIGEKSIAATKAELIKHHPYWSAFSASHQDYLYYFLILGISKLRKGGRFGFITTEYWLKATGAAPLRKYIAEHCRIDNIVLFRNLTLFPDAPGQHNLVIVGERVTDPESDQKATDSHKPRVSIFRADDSNLTPDGRAAVLDAILHSRDSPVTLELNTFKALKSPTVLAGSSWAEVVMTRSQISQRKAIRSFPNKATIEMSEGIIATPQRLRKNQLDKVAAAIAARFAATDGGLGIFELTRNEHDALIAGGLTAEETAAIKPITTTKDVYPYAAVLPESHNWLIWLPHRGDDKFPTNMPHLKKHLKPYKSLLEDTIEGYNATRPWWSAHRARTNLVDGHTATGGWSDLAATTRWGDRKLVAGLLPAGAIPTSALHAMTGDGEATSAAYLVGLINSTPVIALAEALAPGSVSQEDLQALGLPLFAKTVRHKIEKATKQLADLVVTLVEDQSVIFPAVLAALKTDISMSETVTEVWRPQFGEHAVTSTLELCSWVEILMEKPRGKLREVLINEDVLGQHVSAVFDRGAITFTPHEASTKPLQLLASILWGHLGATPGDLTGTAIHMSLEECATSNARDAASANKLVNEYRKLRSSIDDLVNEQLST